MNCISRKRFCTQKLLRKMVGRAKSETHLFFVRYIRFVTSFLIPYWNDINDFRL